MVQLRFSGAARSLREQALPLHFSAQSAALAKLAVGQPVKDSSAQDIWCRACHWRHRRENPSNQTVVWVKTAPERFEPRVITAEPLDGVSVAVTQGLKGR